MAFNFDFGLADIGSTLKGIGSLAGAWGNYESGKAQNKMLKEQFDYAKKRDALVLAKLDERQDVINDAFGATTNKSNLMDNPFNTSVTR